MIKINPILLAFNANRQSNIDHATLYPSAEGICKRYHNPKMGDEVVFEYPRLDSLLQFLNRSPIDFVSPVDDAKEVGDTAPSDWYTLFLEGLQHDEVQSNSATQHDESDEDSSSLDEKRDNANTIPDELASSQPGSSVSTDGGSVEPSTTVADESNVSTETGANNDVGVGAEAETGADSDGTDGTIVESESELPLPSSDLGDGNVGDAVDSLPAEEVGAETESGAGEGDHDSGQPSAANSVGSESGSAGSGGNGDGHSDSVSSGSGDSQPDLESLDTQALKAKCAALGLGQSGTRATLIKRIQKAG